MKRPVVAALLSGLVFPGAGQLYLKRPLRACVFLIPAAVAVVIFIQGLVSRASDMLDQINAGTLLPDPVAIAAQLEKQDGGSLLSNVCAFVMIACWVLSVLDAYLLARKSGQ